MNGKLVETLIGAIVIAVAGMFLSFGYSAANVGGKDGFIIVAKFDRVDGLAVGSDVRMSGIKVGTVVDQRLDPETFLAIVEMDIDTSIELPDDTSARITSDGLLGGSYMSLEAGGSMDLLSSGSEIRYTQGSVDLMGLISKAIFAATGDSEE